MSSSMRKCEDERVNYAVKIKMKAPVLTVPEAIRACGKFTSEECRDPAWQTAVRRCLAKAKATTTERGKTEEVLVARLVSGSAPVPVRTIDVRDSPGASSNLSPLTERGVEELGFCAIERKGAIMVQVLGLILEYTGLFLHSSDSKDEFPTSEMVDRRNDVLAAMRSSNMMTGHASRERLTERDLTDLLAELELDAVNAYLQDLRQVTIRKLAKSRCFGIPKSRLEPSKGNCVNIRNDADLRAAFCKHRDETVRLVKTSNPKDKLCVPAIDMRLKSLYAMRDAIRRAGGEEALSSRDLVNLLAKAERDAVDLYIQGLRQQKMKMLEQSRDLSLGLQKSKLDSGTQREAPCSVKSGPPAKKSKGEYANTRNVDEGFQAAVVKYRDENVRLLRSSISKGESRAPANKIADRRHSEAN